MEKGQNVSWFEELINQAALHARFFEKVVSLSDIPVTSGKEPTIVSHLYDLDFVQANAEHTAADRESNLGLNNAALNGADYITWYPPFMVEFRGAFATNREGVEREESLQALSFATNASFSIVQGGHRVGANNDHFRTGRFWANQEWASEFRNTRLAGAVAANEGDHAKPMFENWSVVFQEDASVVKPAGY